MRKVITCEEHDRYVHLCGRIGLEVAGWGGPCMSCQVLRECLLDHCMSDMAVFSDEDYEKAVDRVIAGFRRFRRGA